MFGAPPGNRCKPSVKKIIAYLTKLKADAKRLTLIAGYVNMSNVTLRLSLLNSNGEPEIFQQLPASKSTILLYTTQKHP
jgi:hypothetical protein